MKSRILFKLVAAIVLLGLAYVLIARGFSRMQRTETGPECPPDTLQADNPVIPLFAKVLQESYPDFVSGYEDGSIVFHDGTSMPCDDGREKDYLERLDDTDIEDMFLEIYPTEKSVVPDYLADSGRYRCEAFFKKMYGDSEAAVRKNLIRVDWFGQKLPFTTVNHAADSLLAVEKELKSLPPDYAKYFAQSSTFYWRKVRGAERLSAHSYGTTIDICVKYSDYWRWSNPGKGETDRIAYNNRIPAEIVEIFEKHGFISGTKWYHFDTMHFEFRPDLLLYARYQ